MRHPNLEPMELRANNAEVHLSDVLLMVVVNTVCRILRWCCSDLIWLTQLARSACDPCWFVD